MQTVSINEPELKFIELFRIALSEDNHEQRQRAIINVKHDVVASRIELLNLNPGCDWVADPSSAGFVQWVAGSSSRRHEAALEYSDAGRRYENRNERKLNIAEHIGLLIWLSIQDGNFEGVQTDSGILQQVRDDAQETRVSGARDKDTLRKTWKTYRNIVHLGMAINYCEDNPSQELNVLHLAELFRRGLSGNCPKGTLKPYVSPEEQISFVYESGIYGPRFQNRGLPFEVR